MSDLACIALDDCRLPCGQEFCHKQGFWSSRGMYQLTGNRFTLGDLFAVLCSAYSYWVENEWDQVLVGRLSGHDHTLFVGDGPVGLPTKQIISIVGT